MPAPRQSVPELLEDLALLQARYRTMLLRPMPPRPDATRRREGRLATLEAQIADADRRIRRRFAGRIR